MRELSTMNANKYTLQVFRELFPHLGVIKMNSNLENHMVIYDEDEYDKLFVCYESEDDDDEDDGSDCEDKMEE